MTTPKQRKPKSQPPTSRVNPEFFPPFWSANSNKLIRNAVDIYKLAHCQGEALAAQMADGRLHAHDVLSNLTAAPAAK